MGKTRRPYAPEFRRRMVELARDRPGSPSECDGQAEVLIAERANARRAADVGPFEPSETPLLEYGEMHQGPEPLRVALPRTTPPSWREDSELQTSARSRR